MTWLLANIGTRDIQLDDMSDVPPELIKKDGWLSPRKAGEYLRQTDQFARFKSRLRLPMIEKTLRLIAPKLDADLNIVLFATDQDEQVPAHYRDSDTIHFAELIKNILYERHKASGLIKKQIQTLKTSHNPADYDMMYEFFHAQLPLIAEKVGKDDQVYFLIAGGTPQMNTMLLFIGTETFGAQAMPLYVSQDSDRASVLDITRQLYKRALQTSLNVMLKAYAYDPALNLLRENRDYLESSAVTLLEGVLRYAAARRNLDFKQALETLDTVHKDARTLRGLIVSLQREIDDQSEAAKLRETVYLSQLAERTGNWADFLSRLFRFSEGCMQLMAEELGVEWSDKKERKSFAPRWWNANRAMLVLQNLATEQVPAGAENDGEARKVDRAKLQTILKALTVKPEHESFQRALTGLDIVGRPVSLRNNIVHRFTPISRDEIEKHAGATIAEILAAMRQAYRDAFNAEVSDESPYDTINRLCHDILQGTK